MIRLRLPGFQNSQLSLLALVTAVIFLGMWALRPDQFLSIVNLRSMSFQFPEFALLSVAVAVTMLTGGIDLSVVSTALLSATLGIILMGSSPQGSTIFWLPGILILTLAAGTACGFLNGFLVTRFTISPILATLGTMQLFLGLTVVLTGGTTIYGFPAAYVFLGNGSVGGVPMPLILFLVTAAGMAFLLNKTAFGYRIYLLGGNPKAAVFAGIRNNRILVLAYVLSGTLSALAGLIMAARTNSVNADYGSSYLLLAILVAVLAGVNPEGGFGRISGLLLAVLSLQFLSSGLNMLRFSSFAKEFVWGALLLLVIVTNQIVSSSKFQVPGFRHGRGES